MTYRVERKHNQFYALVIQAGCVIYKSSLVSSWDAADSDGRQYINNHS
jgi:hypothetical protein